MSQSLGKVTRSDIKREAIFHAALLEFKDKGFAGASMDAIALRAQVSKRTVYNHFASKDELFDAVTNSFWSKTRQAATRPFNPAERIEVQLTAIANQIWQLYHSEEVTEQARILLTELIRQPEFTQQAMQRVNKEDCGLQPFLRQAVAAGVLQIEDFLVAETQLLGLIKSFAFWPRVFQFHDFNQQQQLIIEQTVQMFLSLYQTTD